MRKSFASLSILLLSFTSSAFAAEAKGMTLSEFSNTLLVGGNILTKIMWAACIVVGIALIAAAFTQFQIHRRNPKLVPLTTPVLYLILGIVAVAIPFVDTMKGFVGSPIKAVTGAGKTVPTKSPAPVKGTQKPVYNPNDIDAPLN